MGGNALVSAGTFLAILAGTILGNEVVLTERGTIIISVVVVAVAALGRSSAKTISATNSSAFAATFRAGPSHSSG